MWELEDTSHQGGFGVGCFEVHRRQQLGTIKKTVIQNSFSQCKEC